MFASRQKSHIILDLSNIFTKTITGFSILMWVRPTKSDYGTVLVSMTKIDCLHLLIQTQRVGVLNSFEKKTI